MEESDRGKIVKLAEHNHRLKKLYEEHQSIEHELSRYSARGFLTSTEEAEERTLKAKKLQGVEEMMRILAKNGNGAGH